MVLFIDLIGTFCIVNKNSVYVSNQYVENLIGTFCIVNGYKTDNNKNRQVNLIGTFCIVNLQVQFH